MASDPLAQMQNWIATMQSATDQLQEAGENAADLADEFRETEDKIGEEVADSFLDEVDDFTKTLAQEAKQTNTQVEEFAGALAGAHITKVLDGINYFDEQEDVSVEQLDRFLDFVEKAFENAVDNGLNKVEEGTDAVDSLMDDLEEEVDQSFDGFGSTMDELASDLEEFKQETIDTFDTAIENVADNFTSLMRTAFETIMEAVHATATDQIDNGFDQLGSSFGDMFDNFTSNIEDTSQSLMDMGSEIFTEMVNHCTEAIKDALMDAVEEAITSVIQSLIEELVEQITMMGVGATITGAIAPYVPLLVIAKNVCGVINDLLQVMNLGA